MAGTLPHGGRRAGREPPVQVASTTHYQEEAIVLHYGRRSRVRALAAGALAAAAAALALPAISSAAEANSKVHFNQIQVIGTHDSYHRELTPPERAAFDTVAGRPGAYEQDTGYSHLTIKRQLARQNVRSLEIDLWPDPTGGLYSFPVLRRMANLGPQTDPDWFKPGIKVFHIADADYRTSCVLFTTCLQQIKEWSDANPTHVPLFIMLELKSSDRNWVARGGAQSPAWDAVQYDEIDREIRSIFRDRDLITPDDVRKPGLSVNESIHRFGWPLLNDVRGQVFFHFNNVGNTSPYTDNGHPNLEDRVLFPNANPGQTNSAYRGRDEILDLFSEIQFLVRSNLIVRTRSDVSLGTVRRGDETPVQKALDSGAQVISTDFPTEGMSARYDTDFVSQLPDGVPARCNPIIAPPSCRTAKLELP
jgi:hypothetical protein